ncbi:MAG: hypothetical protein ACQKBU_01995 [Verrucomicrobiales bacterium]
MIEEPDANSATPGPFCPPDPPAPAPRRPAFPDSLRSLPSAGIFDFAQELYVEFRPETRLRSRPSSPSGLRLDKSAGIGGADIVLIQQLLVRARLGTGHIYTEVGIKGLEEAYARTHSFSLPE